MGYAGVQCGTRFIATPECEVHEDYRRAIVAAGADDIVLTEKISGVPVAVIDGPAVRKLGLKASGFAKRLLRHPRTKTWMRALVPEALADPGCPARPGAARPTRPSSRRAGAWAVFTRYCRAGEVVRRFAAALEEES